MSPTIDLELASNRARTAAFMDGDAESLRSVARELVLSGHASVERFAERLGTTARTLQRRLAAAGLTHRRLMDEVRAELLEQALSVGECDLRALAERLGYATAGSLRRARGRWRARVQRSRPAPEEAAEAVKA